MTDHQQKGYNKIRLGALEHRIGEKGLKLFQGYHAVTGLPKDTAVTIGNFDGVHRGHREIIHRVKAHAEQHNLSSAVYTFRPHPVKLLVPHLAPPLINTYQQKVEILSGLDVDYMVEQPFDRAFAAYSPEQFVTEVLHQHLQAKAVFVGFDFTFGRGGKAGVDVLRQLANNHGISVEVATPLAFDGIVASSTKIREFVLEGQVEGARLLLERYFFLEGVVVEGAQRGRQIGFPTANIDTIQELIPAHGVYACWVETKQGMFPAVSNIGVKPTFEEEAQPTIESHLLDFSGDLYGQSVRVHMVKRLRSEQAFSSVEALKQQITEDAHQARLCLEEPTSAPPNRSECLGGLEET